MNNMPLHLILKLKTPYLTELSEGEGFFSIWSSCEPCLWLR